MVKPVDPWPRRHRPLDCRIIDIVRAHRRPVPPQIRGPMTEACKWLAGKLGSPHARQMGNQRGMRRLAMAIHWFLRISLLGENGNGT